MFQKVVIPSLKERSYIFFKTVVLGNVWFLNNYLTSVISTGFRCYYFIYSAFFKNIVEKIILLFIFIDNEKAFHILKLSH